MHRGILNTIFFTIIGLCRQYTFILDLYQIYVISAIYESEENPEGTRINFIPSGTGFHNNRFVNRKAPSYAPLSGNLGYRESGSVACHYHVGTCGKTIEVKSTLGLRYFHAL